MAQRIDKIYISSDGDELEVFRNNKDEITIRINRHYISLPVSDIKLILEDLQGCIKQLESNG